MEQPTIEVIKKIIGRAVLNFDNTNPGFVSFSLISAQSANAAKNKLIAVGYEVKKLDYDKRFLYILIK